MLKPATRSDKEIDLYLRFQISFNCDADMWHAEESDLIKPLTIEECTMAYNIQRWS